MGEACNAGNPCAHPTAAAQMAETSFSAVRR